MYSVVLMMAITTGGEAADCHRHRHNCHGGEAAASCSGGYGGGCSGAYSGGGGCSGAYSGGGCGGGAAPYYGGYAPRPGEPLRMPGDQAPKKEEIKKPISSIGAPGRIVVSLPADARLSIDEYTSPARSDTHIVVSGPLGAEETKTYVLKAEAMRDGRMQATEQRVTVRSGEEKKVTLNLPTSVAAR
jgi:uncharacterized protein (TIGR03000 family)